MARIIAIANQKGGVGKTTTAVNLAASLGVAEQRTLLVDLDPQGNSSSAFGIGKTDLDKHIYHALIEGHPLAQSVLPTPLEHLQIAATNTDLAGAEIELVSAVARERRLSEALDPLADRYDYILVDCPPSLGLLTLNALTAADSVLVPLQCEFYALEGMSHLLSTIQLVQRHLNPRLVLQGIVLTMFDRRNKLSFQVERDVTEFFGEQVFRTRIPRNVRLSESPSFGKPALLYDITAPGTRAYLDLAGELIAQRQADATPHATFAQFAGAAR